MKKQLLIIGGGFAGFWTAMSAVRQVRQIRKTNEVEITLINPDNLVTLRPGLNELSFEGLHFELDKYLKPLGIQQIVGRVEMIDPEKNELIVSSAQGIKCMFYDFLVLSSGASLKVSKLPGIDYSFNLSTPANCRRLEEHIMALAKRDFQEEGAATFVVVGSEFPGLEIVTSIGQKIRSAQAYYNGNKSDFRIVLLENDRKIASRFPPECQQYIRDVLKSKNVEVVTNVEVKNIGPSFIILEDHTSIATRTVIWTKGVVASSLTQFFNGGKDELNRLAVNKFLKVPAYNNVIAAGNVAHGVEQNEFSSVMDCQYAQLEGRWAGHNAINDLFYMPLKEYVPPAYHGCMELGEPQIVYGNEWESSLQKRRYEDRATEKHINRVTMYPWQDVEETVKASYPEIPKL